MRNYASIFPVLQEIHPRVLLALIAGLEISFAWIKWLIHYAISTLRKVGLIMLGGGGDGRETGQRWLTERNHYWPGPDGARLGIENLAPRWSDPFSEQEHAVESYCSDHDQLYAFSFDATTIALPMTSPLALNLTMCSECSRLRKQAGIGPSLSRVGLADIFARWTRLRKSSFHSRRHNSPSPCTPTLE
jgi:hypothetical protein